MGGVQTDNRQQTTENAKVEASLNLRFAESGTKKKFDIFIFFIGIVSRGLVNVRPLVKKCLCIGIGI